MGLVNEKVKHQGFGEIIPKIDKSKIFFHYVFWKDIEIRKMA